MSEKQILDGNLTKFKLLIVPAVKYIPPEIVSAVKNISKMAVQWL